MHSLIGNKKFITLCVIIICITVPCCVLLFMSKDVKPENFSYSIICRVRENTDIYELRRYQGNKCGLYFNGDKIEDIKKINDAYVALTLSPQAMQTDLSKLTPSSDLTWNIDLFEASGVVNKFLADGYTIIREANTPQYIELFLQKDKERKRLILFETSLMCGDLTESSVLPSVSTYFVEYNLSTNIGG